MHHHQLLIFFRGVDTDMNVCEEFLDMISLKDQTTGKEMYNYVVSVINDFNLQWNKIIGVITDGAPSMVGVRKVLSTFLCTKIEEDGGSPIKLHCIIHQKDLSAKHIKFDNVINPVIKAINFIRSTSLSHHQFKQFLQNMNSEYGDIVYYTEIRWLSRGAELKRFYSIRT